MAHIDNSFYETLGERWYEAYDDPVALLRAESRVKTPWILDRMPLERSEVLDVGCGAGFLSNELAKSGHSVTGVDLSPESLRVARAHDETHAVQYVVADALKLPYPDQKFDVVTSMDFLEHVENPAAFIREFSRVLKPGGLFFFHTFNRNTLSHLLVIKAVEKLVKNTPKNMHVIELFITPEEIKSYCQEAGLQVKEMTGLRPVFSSIPLPNLLSGVVPGKMRFKFTRSLLLSYMGMAKKTM